MAAFEEPGRMRSKLSEEGGILCLRIPMRRSILLLVFMASWLSFWSYAGVETGKNLLREFQLFTFAWMGMWVVGEVFGAYSLLRTATGEDCLLLASDRLTVSKKVLGIGIERNYRPLEIRRLRWQPSVGGGRSHRPSCIAFDYGAKTIGFGDGLDEAEAIQLISMIRSRCNIAEIAQSSVTAGNSWGESS